MSVTPWIEYPLQPKELILAWVPPLSVSGRSRWAVGRLSVDGNDAVFRYFDERKLSMFNLGRTSSELKAAGFAGYPAFNAKKQPPEGFKGRVLEAFLRRIPPASRSDFTQYLEHFCIRPRTPLSPFQLLAVTEAQLPSDGFSLIDPLDPEVREVDILFEIAGSRHYPEANSLVQPGDKLLLFPDPANVVDPMAVQIRIGHSLVGFVNRLQAPTVRSWLNERTVSCSVARIHAQGDSRRPFAFLQVRS
jgi:hypothetical protein